MYDIIKSYFLKKDIHVDMCKVHIVLIPKIHHPISINDFRPISLCNVSYKNLSKILVDGIRPFLKDLIGPFQSSFIPGRKTTDNVIVTQKVIHSLNKCSDKKWGIV